MAGKIPSESEPIEIRILEGPVTVSYRKVGRKWYCTALEFDLVGIGPNRDSAFSELQGIVSAYLEEVFRAEGEVSFFNPSDREEWNNPEQEYYRVVVAFVHPKRAPELPKRLSISEARQFGKRIRSVQLTA